MKKIFLLAQKSAKIKQGFKQQKQKEVIIMNFGFIGAGNMVSAIVKGMTIGTKSYDGNCIYVTSKSGITAEELAKTCSAHFCKTASEVVAASDVLVLGVKPHVLAEILPNMKADIDKKKPLIISIAAGKTLEYIGSLLSERTPIVRVMPNINGKIGASTTGICKNDFVTAEQFQIAKEMFSTIGTVIEIAEQQFSVFSVIGGASVAFAYLYMDALSRAALKAGMTKKQALEITAETVLGSAKMVLESGEHPYALIDQVCSPGGTTIEGICSLQSNNFESTIISAFDAVLQKDKWIARKK